jgi:phage tail sheath protein FI
MATRTITSPGVEIRERDLSLRIPQNIGTNVFLAGFANQGPTDEVIKISTRDELEQIYGTPTNSSERYFYYSARELLLSPANIYTFRLPYGADAGAGFSNVYSALVYPTAAIYDGAVTTNLDLSAGTYVLGAPAQVTLTESQYRQALEGTLFDWSLSATTTRGFLSATSDLGKAGVIVLNKAQTTINSQFEGYYVGLADNSNINPATNFDAIIGINTVSMSGNFVSLPTGISYTTIPNGTLQFNLSATPNQSTGSISEIMENLTNYNINDREDDDLLNVAVFKLRKSIYATEAFKLDYILDDALVGSIDTFRTELNPAGGPAVSKFLESVDTNSRNIEIMVNPYISNKFRDTSLDLNGIPQKKIRILTQGLISNYPILSSQLLGSGNNANIPLSSLQSLSATLGYADRLNPLGTFNNVVITQKAVGNIPTKINRALETVKNDEIYDIDLVVEGGLGTIFSMACAANTSYYDETLYNSTIANKLSTIRTSQSIDNNTDALAIRTNYTAVFNQFENFCNLPSNTGGRGDCMFVADAIRHFVVTGKNSKVLSDRTKTFQTDVYWAIRHQFETANTSYAAVYGNWVQSYDDFTGDKYWMPFSAHAAAVMARTDANDFPWIAPAGFNRGVLTTSALDLAINPNQKQRDELYKVNINPVYFSSSDGMVIMGQKTLSRKPSAFDRINVRRLFLTLERPVKKVSKYFLFEPNTEFTRTRFVNTITPLFEFAKQNQGLYDYLIVADERVNTPEVIDNNELRADILIKPTRAAEFILVTFTATRTDANFNELI